MFIMGIRDATVKDNERMMASPLLMTSREENCAASTLLAAFLLQRGMILVSKIYLLQEQKDRILRERIKF